MRFILLAIVVCIIASVSGIKLDTKIQEVDTSLAGANPPLTSGFAIIINAMIKMGRSFGESVAERTTGNSTPKKKGD